jgi:hypothetical protein
VSCGPTCCSVSDERNEITLEMIREHVIKHAQPQDCNCDACLRVCACGSCIRYGQSAKCSQCQQRGMLK